MEPTVKPGGYIAKTQLVRRRVQPVGLVAFVVLLVGCGGCNPAGDVSAATSRRDASDNPAQDRKPAIQVREFTVVHDGVRVRVREKTLGESGSVGRILVLLPSASYCTQPNWDLQFAGHSVMDFFASEGRLVVAIDLPGYGQADDPPNPMQFGAAEATEWVDSVINQVVEEHAVDRVDMLGWSWGAQVAGRYAQEFPHRVRRLVLYGFTYAKRIPKDALPAGYLDKPFRKLTREFAMSDFVSGCYDPSVADAYATACLAADDQVPTGPLTDYVNRLPIVDPTRLTMPCLVICGQFELEPPTETNGTMHEFFASRRSDLESFCQSLPNKTGGLVIVPGGGHAVHLEKPAHDWLRSVESFLDSP
jgi:pimeloyl-ACP methyl ester carboxylesterase